MHRRGASERKRRRDASLDNHEATPQQPVERRDSRRLKEKDKNKDKSKERGSKVRKNVLRGSLRGPPLAIQVMSSRSMF